MNRQRVLELLSRSKPELQARFGVTRPRHSRIFDDIGMFAAGFVAAFFSALIAVRGLIRFISNHDFTVLAWYRIIFGCVILLRSYTGVWSGRRLGEV